MPIEAGAIIQAKFQTPGGISNRIQKNRQVPIRVAAAICRENRLN
jgi:hypothetical protein